MYSLDNRQETLVEGLHSTMDDRQWTIGKGHGVLQGVLQGVLHIDKGHGVLHSMHMSSAFTRQYTFIMPIAFIDKGHGVLQGVLHIDKGHGVVHCMHMSSAYCIPCGVHSMHMSSAFIRQ